MTEILVQRHIIPQINIGSHSIGTYAHRGTHKYTPSMYLYSWYRQNLCMNIYLPIRGHERIITDRVQILMCIKNFHLRNHFDWRKKSFLFVPLNSFWISSKLVIVQLTRAIVSVVLWFLNANRVPNHHITEKKN